MLTVESGHLAWPGSLVRMSEISYIRELRSGEVKIAMKDGSQFVLPEEITFAAVMVHWKAYRDSLQKQPVPMDSDAEELGH